MSKYSGVSNYVFEEDRKAEEDALTEKLFEYAMMQPKSSWFGSLGNVSGYNMNALARSIQEGRDTERNRKEYLENGRKWLSQERRRLSDAELLNAIKTNPVFRRRIMTLQNPETFNDSFWNGL